MTTALNPDLFLNLDVDIEAELIDDEHSHAIPFCSDHRSQEWFPVAGSIVEVLCGRLIRIRHFLGYSPSKEKVPCTECVNFKGMARYYVCRRKVYS
jgi:hypothetical protein